MDIFVPIRFKTSVQLAPADLAINFEEILLHKVRTTLEGVCSRYGYIKPGSIEIIKRSVGSFVKQHFNGHIKFEIVCQGEVCNPSVGTVFKAIVRNKNALGIHAESSLEINGKDEPVLDIIIPRRSVGIVSNIDLDDIQTGETIYIEVLGKRYQLKDKKISVIGRAIKEPMQVQGRKELVDAQGDDFVDPDVEPIDNIFDETDDISSDVDQEDGDEESGSEEAEDDVSDADDVARVVEDNEEEEVVDEDNDDIFADDIDDSEHESDMYDNDDDYE